MSSGAAGAAPVAAAPPQYVAAPAPPAGKRVRLIGPLGGEEHADDNPWLHMRLQDAPEQQVGARERTRRRTMHDIRRRAAPMRLHRSERAPARLPSKRAAATPARPPAG